MTSTIVPASFRDPAGFVWSDGGQIYRHVSEDHRERYDLLMSSGLYEDLIGAGSMVPHEEVTGGVTSPRPGAYKILKPEMVRFISYPYEWCFSQLKDAALLTLEVQKRAMEVGMSLHDASAYNVQFHEGRPMLIDTLSFEPIREGKPWIAYGQFCRHFLAPLALMAYRDVRLGELSRLHIDGVPLDLASELLPRRTRLSPGLLAHIHAQGRLQSRHQRSGAPRTTKRGVSLEAFKGIVWNLEKTVRKLEWRMPKTAWSDYYERADHYSETAQDHKRELVDAFLEAAGGSTVWDLGGNVGVFSRLATARGREVVCFDVDPGCVEANYRRVRSEGERRLLPLLCDLRNPAPSIGWANTERYSLAERGPADVALALALVHHLAIANNVPLALIADYLAELASWTIIEFVPKSDPMVQGLLATRDDIFDAYTEEGFERAFEARFSIHRRESVADSGRILYLMKRK